MKKRMMLIGMVAAMLSIAAPAYAQDSTEPAPPDKGVKPVGLYISEVRLTAGGKVVEAAPPGEPVTARLTAVNQGDKAVHNVVLTVGKAPEGLRVIDGTANFGDIAAGADATANISFEASLKGCQDGLGLEATFSYSNGDEPTGFGFAIACPGPRLFVDNARYEGGDGDQVPEPGETLKVFLTLRNEGRDTATDVRGVYHLLSGKVRIIDDSATWPDIAPQKTGTNETPLVIEIAKDADVAQSCMGAIQTGPPVGVDDKGAPPQDGGTVTPDGGTVSSDGSAGTAPADQPNTSSGGGSASSSGSTETTPEARLSAPPADQPATQPEPVDPAAMFDGTLKVSATGDSYDVSWGTVMVCAYAEGMRPGALPPGVQTKGDGARDGASAPTGAHAPGGRGGSLAIAAVLLGAVGLMLGRYRFARAAATRNTTPGE